MPKFRKRFSLGLTTAAAAAATAAMALTAGPAMAAYVAPHSPTSPPPNPCPSLIRDAAPAQIEFANSGDTLVNGVGWNPGSTCLEVMLYNTSGVRYSDHIETVNPNWTASSYSWYNYVALDFAIASEPNDTICVKAWSTAGQHASVCGLASYNSSGLY
jgi:hypothetical protein